MSLLKRHLNPTFLLYRRTDQTGSTWHIGALREFRRLWPSRPSVFGGSAGRAGWPRDASLLSPFLYFSAFGWVPEPQSQEIRQLYARKTWSIKVSPPLVLEESPVKGRTWQYGPSSSYKESIPSIIWVHTWERLENLLKPGLCSSVLPASSHTLFKHR